MFGQFEHCFDTLVLEASYATWHSKFAIGLTSPALLAYNSAGVWKDEDHPDTQSEEDIERWINNLRSAWVVGILCA
jgi:hypothetical protein